MDAARQAIRQNQHIGLHQLSSTLSISYGSAQALVKKDLLLRKRAPKMIPHQLTPNDLRRRIDFCTDFVSIYGSRPAGLNWIMTTDESWFHVYDPLSKVQSLVWLLKGEQRPTILRREMSVKKLMFIPFFDSHGLVHAEFFRNQTVTKELFKALLQHVRVSLRIRRGAYLWSQRQDYRIHMDNAPAHRAKLTQDYLRDNHWPVLKHPPYSPDLSPADFFLFPVLKRRLRGHDFRTLDALEDAILQELGNITARQWKQCFTEWIARCRKCLQFRGHYFEGMSTPPPV